MPGDVDGKQADAPVVDREDADQIAANMAAGLQEQGDLRPAEVVVAHRHQRLLQLARLDALVRSVYNDVLTKEQRKKCGVWQQGVSPMAETPFVHHGRMRRLRHVWKTSGTTIEL